MKLEIHPPSAPVGAILTGWNADYSYVERVGKESFLEAVELSERPRTCFCNQYIALDTLPHATAAKRSTLARALPATSSTCPATKAMPCLPSYMRIPRSHASCASSAPCAERHNAS